MIELNVNTKEESPDYTADLVEIGDFRLLAVVPRHWPANEERIERLKNFVKQVNEAENNTKKIETLANALYGMLMVGGQEERRDAEAALKLVGRMS